MMSARGRIDFAQAAGLVTFIAIIIVLWNTWAVYPLRLLVVFFHELSHGLAALATGGSIVEIQMSAQEGGHCVTRGGSRFLTISAGYLGSLLWGGLILLIATRTKASQIGIEVLGALLLLVTVIWVRPVIGFGFGFGLVTGLVLVASAYLFRPIVHETMMTAIGLTSCMYAVLDIKSDVLDRPEAVSDAVLLANETGIPAWAWGVSWFAISILLAVRFILVASRHVPENAPPTSNV